MSYLRELNNAEKGCNNTRGWMLVIVSPLLHIIFAIDDLRISRSWSVNSHGIIQDNAPLIFKGISHIFSLQWKCPSMVVATTK